MHLFTFINGFDIIIKTNPVIHIYGDRNMDKYTILLADDEEDVIQVIIKKN